MSGEAASFDLLIIGGGTAGCVLAARLTEDPGLSVCLVEAGPDYGPHGEGRWPDDMLSCLGVPDSHDWRDAHGSLPASARIIGGCSAHNVCLVTAGAPADYDAWGGDWSWELLAPYFERAKGMLPLRRFGHAELNPWFQGMLEAAAELGLPVHADLEEATLGAGRVAFNVEGTTRWNAAFAYLDAARARPNLTLLAETQVDRLELDGERVAGVHVNPGGLLRAERVVVCAGTYNSPAILLRSGIGPERQLARHGIPVRAELPVGERLRRHFGVPLRFAPTERMRALIDEHVREHPPYLCQGVVKVSSRHCPAGTWDLHLLTSLLPGGDGSYILGSSSMLLRPEWLGSVRLRTADPRELPLVSEISLDSDRDVEAVSDGLELGRRLACSQALAGLAGDELAPGPGDLRAAGRDGLTDYFHPVASCADATEGPSGRLRGFDNLYVADASLLPELPAAPTMLTVLATAELVAERLARA